MATLKVRVRAATGGPTLRVQLPQPATLRALKDAIASQIGTPASSFDVSLNKKDSINGPSDVQLSAFGVINGDLLFYIPSTGDSVPVSLSSFAFKRTMLDLDDSAQFNFIMTLNFTPYWRGLEKNRVYMYRLPF